MLAGIGHMPHHAARARVVADYIARFERDVRPVENP